MEDPIKRLSKLCREISPKMKELETLANEHPEDAKRILTANGISFRETNEPPTFE